MMIKKFRLLIVIFVLLVVPFVSYAGSEAIINFEKSLSLQEFEQMMARQTLNVREIYFQQGKIQGGYTLDYQETFQMAVQNLFLKHIQALNNMIGAEKNGRNCDDLIGELSNALVATETHLRISGMKIEGNSQRQPFVKKDAVENTNENINYQEIRSDQNLSSVMYYIDEDYWAPRYGTSKTNQYMAFNSFTFTDVSGFSQNDGIMTYEHETQIYDKSFADYDNYWISNLPNAYYDTPFLDSIDNFTIGSSQASSISVNTQYWTYIALKPQTSSSAGVIIKGQLGHRSPSWCYSTWCIYPDMTTGWLYDYTAPISTQQSWSYNP